MLWHYVSCGCTCNLARLIVPMLACIWQAQFIHSNAVVCCRMRLHRQPGTFLVPMVACIWQAQFLHSNAVACCRMRLHRQPGTFLVPMLACVWQAQLIHSNTMACCRMRLHRQPGTFHSAYAGLHLTSAASSQQCFGMLSHAVAHVTWHIS